GLVRLHLRPDPDRGHARRGSALRRPARDLVRRPAPDRRDPEPRDPPRAAAERRPGPALAAAGGGDGSAPVTGRLAVRFGALGYLAAVLLAPVALIFYRALEHGLKPFWEAISNPNAVHALWMTVQIALVTVPLNTIFGIVCAIAIVRR